MSSAGEDNGSPRLTTSAWKKMPRNPHYNSCAIGASLGEQHVTNFHAPESQGSQTQHQRKSPPPPLGGGPCPSKPLKKAFDPPGHPLTPPPGGRVSDALSNSLASAPQYRGGGGDSFVRELLRRKIRHPNFRHPCKSQSLHCLTHTLHPKLPGFARGKICHLP